MLGPEGSHTRVFVNNHNTRVPTVTLPSSASRREPKSIPGLNAYARLRSGNDRQPERVGDRHQTDGVNFASKKNTPGVAGIMKEDLHPHLEDVYQRVMRKLQRKANYEEINNFSLAEQFGILDTFDADKSKVEWDSEGAGQSGASLSSIQTIGRKNSSLRRRPPGRAPARLASAAQGENVDDTYFLSHQPCPKTLRLVLEMVKTIVAEKLCYAESGSLKNCLCFVFESRSLLDRLLKEIPLYSHFQGEGERLPTAMQMQDMFQEFRRQPVLLPSAQFVKEPNTGRVVACISDDGRDVSCCPAQQGGDPASPALSPRQDLACSSSSPTQTKLSPAFSPVEVPQFMGVEPPQKVELPNGVAITIPATYGRSNRGRQAGGRHAQASGGSPTQTPPQLPAVDGGGGARGGAVHSPTKRSGDAFWAAGPLSSDMAVGTLPREPSTRQQSPTAEELLLEKRQATQKISTGTLTEINETTIVSREEYKKLQEYNETLAVEIQELKQELDDLRQQLSEERDYTLQKQKVVKYLRQTLYKECCVLRSQLSMAEQKKIHYQTLLKEQQNMMVQNPNYAGGDTRSLCGTSLCDTTRLPSLHARLTTNELSVMTTSIGCASSSVRRLNVNGSGVSASHNAGTVDEQDDAAISVFGSGAGLLTGPQRISVDVTAIHSLLDLVLLAVENDQVLPANASKGKNANMNIIASAMKDDEHKRLTSLRNEFTERERQIKHYFAINRAETASKIALKNHQIERLKSFSNVHYLKVLWDEKCTMLRGELRRVRNMVQEDLSSLKRFVVATMDSIIKRSRVVDTTLGDNHSLHTTQLALRDVISSARSLLMPMLSMEYGRGYHPWPLKLRNTIDPFAHIVKARYGEKQLVFVREEVNALSAVYLAVHNYVLGHQIVPNIKRPMPGKTLRTLCASLVLNTGASAELWLQVRERYAEERALEQRIALLNMSIVFFMHRQRAMTERSAEAMYEAGMDPRVSGLPAQRAINEVAGKLHKLIAERTQLRKQRQENARSVFRLWKSKCIDIFEGYATPTPPQRLVVAEMEAVRKKTQFLIPLAGNHSRGDGQQQALRTRRKSQDFWTTLLSSSEKEKDSSHSPEQSQEAAGVQSNALRSPKSPSVDETRAEEDEEKKEEEKNEVEGVSWLCEPE